MMKWIKEVVRPSSGMAIHAALGGAVGVIAAVVAPDHILWFCTFISVFGFTREMLKAGHPDNFNFHKFLEGLAWCTCWFALLL